VHLPARSGCPFPDRSAAAPRPATGTSSSTATGAFLAKGSGRGVRPRSSQGTNPRRLFQPRWLFIDCDRGPPVGVRETPPRSSHRPSAHRGWPLLPNGRPGPGRDMVIATLHPVAAGDPLTVAFLSFDAVLAGPPVAPYPGGPPTQWAEGPCRVPLRDTVDPRGGGCGYHALVSIGGAGNIRGIQSHNVIFFFQIHAPPCPCCLLSGFVVPCFWNLA